MMAPVYIRSSAAISPQHSFRPDAFLNSLVHTQDGKLFVVEADYRQYINPVAIRRMSRLMKMGISTGMEALQLAGIDSPDAIITGTGLGSMTDMEHFLTDMIRLQEEALNPTYFIQSTYNSINGWIALQAKCTAYNQTYVNRGLSLEMSLLDAQLLLAESRTPATALVGCFDELTPDYFKVKSKCHYWKRDLPDSAALLRHSDTPGTIAGEGTAFFTLSNQPEAALCVLRGMHTIQAPAAAAIGQQLEDFLKARGLDFSDIDLVLTGRSGDSRFEGLYQAALSNIGGHTTEACFKHLCGEYPTTSGFALWLAVRLLAEQSLPEEIIYRKGHAKEIRNVLIVNHYILDTASFLLLSRS